MKSREEQFIDYTIAKANIQAVQLSLEIRLEKIRKVKGKEDVVKDLEDMVKMLRRSWIAFSEMEQRYTQTYKLADKLHLENEGLQMELKELRNKHHEVLKNVEL